MLSWAFAAVETITLAALGPKWVGLVVCLLPVVGDRECSAEAALAPASSHALQSLRFPGMGRPVTTTSRVSASTRTWWLVKYR